MYALASPGSPPLLRGRRGTMCTAKGSDVRPGVPWVSASFAWQAWHNVHCQGVGCTPWRPLGLRLFCVAGVAQCALPRGRMYALASPASPSLLRGRRGTMCTAKGSDVRPGVPWVSASFAWQAWHNVHCQGVGCTLWRPLGLRLFCVAGVAQCALPRGRMYALAALGSPPLSVAGVAQCALPRVRMYALASPGSPPLLRGMCTAKGSDVRPGVPRAGGVTTSPKSRRLTQSRSKAFPLAETYRNWRIKTREAVVAASTDPDSAFKWVSDSWKEDQTLEALRKVAPFATLDAKLLSALTNIITGDFAR